MKMVKRERRRVGYCVLGFGWLCWWNEWEVLDGWEGIWWAMRLLSCDRTVVL